VPELTTVDSPKGKRKNGVLELFSPRSPRRKKRHSNNVPIPDSFNSLNGSVLSKNIEGGEEAQRFANERLVTNPGESEGIFLGNPNDC